MKRKNPNAVALGRKGGKARAAALTAEERKRISSNAANVRWSKKMTSTIQTYSNRDRAERATALRSRNAALRGECSQFEVRQLGTGGCVGGYQGELAERFPTWRIVGQWSEGYRQ